MEPLTLAKMDSKVIILHPTDEIEMLGTADAREDGFKGDPLAAQLFACLGTADAREDGFKVGLRPCCRDCRPLEPLTLAKMDSKTK